MTAQRWTSHHFASAAIIERLFAPPIYTDVARETILASTLSTPPHVLRPCSVINGTFILSFRLPFVEEITTVNPHSFPPCHDVAECLSIQPLVFHRNKRRERKGSGKEWPQKASAAKEVWKLVCVTSVFFLCSAGPFLPPPLSESHRLPEISLTKFCTGRWVRFEQKSKGIETN